MTYVTRPGWTHWVIDIIKISLLIRSVSTRKSEKGSLERKE